MWIQKLSFPLVLIFLGLSCAPQNIQTQDPPSIQPPFERLWSAIDSLERIAFFREALDSTQVVLNYAKQTNAPQHIVKSLIYQSNYIQQIEEQGSERALRLLDSALLWVEGPEKAILQSLTAQGYLSYFRARRHLISSLTESNMEVPDDLRLWTAGQLLERVHELFEASLDHDFLRTTPVGQFEEIIDTSADAWAAPTIYDVLARKALAFYQTDEALVTRPAERFYIENETALAPARDFVKASFETADSQSHQLKTLRLYQDLIRFHLADDDPRALLLADMSRLEYCHRNGIIANADSLYLHALTTIENSQSGQPLSGVAAWYRAQYYFSRGATNKNGGDDENGNFAKAMDICEKVISRFPDSWGAQKCRNLRKSIMRKSLDFSCETVVSPDKPFLISVRYRNIDSLALRMYRVTVEESLRFSEMKRDEQQDFLARRVAERSWQQVVPGSQDYQAHRAEIPVDGMPEGVYVLVMNVEDGAADESQLERALVVRSSSLAALHRVWKDTAELFVVDRETGLPLSDVTTMLYAREYNPQSRTWKRRPAGKPARTNTDGFASHLMGSDGYFSFRLIHKADTLAPDKGFYGYRPGRIQTASTRQTAFFLDRSIYRPGQTVYFKCLLTEAHAGDYPEALRGEAVTVTLLDVNRKEIKTLRLKSNEFGTVNGSFQLPSSGLTGRMYLKSSAGERWHSFRVEEYKRPRFEVAFTPPSDSLQLNSRAEIKAGATAYTGSPVVRGKVRYRVVRQARFPGPYRGWSRDRGQEIEIASGETVTDANGQFVVSFTAIPDRSIPQSARPVFDFRIEADVTDLSGETRSALTSVSIGYTAVNLSMEVPATAEADSFTTIPIRALTWNGVPAALQGRLTITALEKPDRLLRPRLWEHPDQFVLSEIQHRAQFPIDPYKEENDIHNWKVGKEMFATTYSTDTTDHTHVPFKALPPGAYRIVATATDPSGAPLETKAFVQVTDLSKGEIAYGQTLAFQSSSGPFEPGERAEVQFGSTTPGTAILYELENGNNLVLDQHWLAADERPQVSIPVHSEDRGNMFWHATVVRHGRVNIHTGTIEVPWSNKELDIQYTTFRNQLEPGTKEEWLLTIRGPKRDAVAAEMVAALYDQSLDQFSPHSWSLSMAPWNRPQRRLSPTGLDASESALLLTPGGGFRMEEEQPPRYPDFSISLLSGRQRWRTKVFAMDADGMAPETAAMPMAEGRSAEPDSEPANQGMANDQEQQQTEPEGENASPPLQIRRNLRETVFFYPELRTDESGNIIIRFTMNEALTRWKFLGMAHTEDLKYALTSAEVVTKKDLMVMPNPPRFLREGDRIVFSARVDNLSAEAQTGSARLSLFNALTMEPVDAQFDITNPEITFSADASQSAAVHWELTVPPVSEVPVVLYRIIATSGKTSDGEENAIPVVTNRQLVTETMPLPVGGRSTETFRFDRMGELTAASSTLRSSQLTLEMTENPAWYAIKALPSLHDIQHPTADALFGRYFSNALAGHLLETRPEIQQVVVDWQRRTPTETRNPLASALEYNQDLKSALLSETPWVQDAMNEEERARDLVRFFDSNRIEPEQQDLLEQLRDLQGPQGGFSWFARDRENWYTTQSILEGFGHFKALLGSAFSLSPLNQRMVDNAIAYMDEKVARAYDQTDKPDLTAFLIHSLYTRSFFEAPIPERSREAYAYFRSLASTQWPKRSVYEQGMIALCLHRTGDPETADLILQSLTDRSLFSAELGRYWKYTEGYTWNQLPVKTHTLLMEAFDEIKGDTAFLESMKIWLLKHKQTNSWRSGKSTAAAVYVLLKSGEDWLKKTGPIEIKMGGNLLDVQDIQKEAGTGYFRKDWTGKEVEPQLAEISISNPNAHIAWGGLYWQYFEDLDKISAFRETPLTLRKSVYKTIDSPEGPRLVQLSANDPLRPGDLLTIRIEMAVDRDMEYVHMKDMRASGFEPLHVLSGYRYRSGLGYYESTRDLATHFYFSRLPKGAYAFEYPVRVAQAGDFSSGITTIQSMYAPEFSSHSEGTRIVVQE